jgi:hypothetical protein
MFALQDYDVETIPYEKQIADILDVDHSGYFRTVSAS